MGFETIMFDTNGNIQLTNVFVNSWFFGYIDFAFLFVLFASIYLLNRYGLRFGQMIGIIFGLSLAFATISGSLLMWGITILMLIFSGLRIIQNILSRV